MSRKRIVLMLAAIVVLLITGFAEVSVFQSSKRGNAGIVIGGTAVAGTSDGKTTVGVKVTRPVPTAVESLHDVKTRAAARPQPVKRDRAIPFRRIQKPGDTPIFTPRLSLSLSAVVTSLFAPASMAPALDNSFAGSDNPPPGPDIVPPDTMGAAGPNHLVSALNSDFAVFDKAGNLLSRVTLNDFWTFTDSPGVNTFDPKVLFDQNSGRFIVSSAAGESAPNSWIMIAVSQTSDPEGNWVKVAIDADADADNVVRSNSADFPGLGIDNVNIYIAANMFNTLNFYQYSKAWAIPKTQLLGGSAPSQLEYYEFRDPAGSDSSMQPAHTFGTPGAEYIAYEGINNLHLAKITFPGGVPTWENVGPVSVNSFTSTSFLPGVPQLGNSNTIDAGDTRVLNAVYRNDYVWTSHHVQSGGKIEVAWYQINPLTLTATDQGRINHASRWYIYPSIAVNQDGDVGIGFSGSSSTEYIGAYYTARRSSDASETMQPVTLLKTGETDYYKTLSGADNRWGDYSGTTVDPADNVSFWTIQEYAKPKSGSTSMWGTWWGRFRPSAVTAPTGLTATTVSSSRVDLIWPDSDNETGYTVERRLYPAGDFAEIAALSQNSTSYIDNTGLAASSTYFYRVKATSGSDGSYSSEASAATSSSPSTPSGGGGGGGGCAISNRHGDSAADVDLSELCAVLALLFPLGVIALLRRGRRHVIR
ncbi:MAG: fibronectin type III domain-containing protein [Deltaproteobacteria bacterium]|nr:fibronectin type III domain-containing protein [Deltaproteobacteria bacterium]